VLRNQAQQLCRHVGFLSRRQLGEEQRALFFARAGEWRRYQGSVETSVEPGVEGLVFGLWCAVTIPLAWCLPFVLLSEPTRKHDVHTFAWILSCVGVLLQLRTWAMIFLVAVAQIIAQLSTASHETGCIERAGLNVSVLISLLSILEAEWRERDLRRRFSTMQEFDVQQVSFTSLIDAMVPKKVRDVVLRSTNLGLPFTSSQYYDNVSLLFVQLDVVRAISRLDDGAQSSGVVQDLNRVFNIIDDIVNQEQRAYKVENVKKIARTKYTM